MDYLDHPLVVATIVALVVAVFWKVTHRAGSPEQMGPGGVDRMDDYALWSRFRRRPRDQESHPQASDRS